MSNITKREYEALLAFRTALRKFLRYAEEGARQAGVTPQQHQTMLVIKGQPGREWATVGDIAEALQITHHAAVGLVDRCEEAHLIQRAHDLEDRRHVRVVLTDVGEEVLERLSARNLEELQNLRKALKSPDPR